MSSTREPPSASASARLHAVVVLPSSGWLLVTAMIRVDSLPLVNTSDVRSERNASPKSCGTVSVSTGTRSPRSAGTRPSSGSFSRRVMSSGVLTVSSRYSMPKARPKATVRPARIAVSQSRRGLGEIGGVWRLGAVHQPARCWRGCWRRPSSSFCCDRAATGRSAVRCPPCAAGCGSRRSCDRGRRWRRWPVRGPTEVALLRRPPLCSRSWRSRSPSGARRRAAWRGVDLAPRSRASSAHRARKSAASRDAGRP